MMSGLQGSTQQSMDLGQSKPNPAFPPLILAIVTLPFMLLGWLLVDRLIADVYRYQRVDEAIQLFDLGIEVVGHLEQVRDLGAARFHGSGAVLQDHHLRALAQLDSKLPEFLQAIEQRNVMLSQDQVSAIVAARQSLTEEPVQADFIGMFDLSSTLVERIYEALFNELRSTDILFGEPISANELLLIMAGKVRSARQQVGLLRTLSLQASLGSGFLASANASRFDTAWGTLHDDLQALARQVHALEERGLNAQRSSALQAEHAQVWAYLEKMAEQVLVSERVELDWREAYQDGQQSMDSLATMALTLLSEVRDVAGKAKVADLRTDALLLAGLIVLYLLLLGFALLLFRSRYEILRIQTENITKSQFLARMSHEIRTPLNGVVGLAELLRDTAPSAQQRQYIELIENSGRSLIGLVDDVLDHARIEAGKLELERIPFSLHTLISECAYIFSLRAHDNDSVIYWSVSDGVPTQLIGDPARLRQVLINLLSNAVKFTEHGLVEVAVSLKGRADDLCQLHFEVRDSGIGLTTEEQGGLFNLFAQASTSVSRRYGGSGLGLSISRELIQLMGGDIGVRSARNWGSTFYFTVALADCTPAGQFELERPAPEQVSEAILFDQSGQLQRLVQGRENYQHVQVVSSIEGCMELLKQSHNNPLLVIHCQRPGLPLEVLLASLQPFAKDSTVRLVVGVRGGVTAELLSRFKVTELITCTVFSRRDLAALFAPYTEASAESQPTLPASATVPLSGLRVLVAEDNPVNQIVTEGMLRRLGVEAKVVDDGLAALQAYEQSNGDYDLILMDLDMPVMGGITAAEEIRALEHRQAWSACRIIALSAHVLPEYQQQVSAAGMDGQLSKPVSLEQLRQVIAQQSVIKRQN